MYDAYYPATASSLNKRPMGEIAAQTEKKKGDKKSNMKPHTKKTFTNVVSKIDTGVKKRIVAQTTHISDGLTAKRKEEMFGRISSEALAKFLTQKYT